MGETGWPLSSRISSANNCLAEGSPPTLRQGAPPDTCPPCVHCQPTVNAAVLIPNPSPANLMDIGWSSFISQPRILSTPSLVLIARIVCDLQIFQTFWRNKSPWAPSFSILLRFQANKKISVIVSKSTFSGRMVTLNLNGNFHWGFSVFWSPLHTQSSMKFTGCNLLDVDG